VKITTQAKAIFCIVAGSDDDMEYYVRECSEILGVTNKLPADARDAKHILEYILAQVAEFKKLNQVCK
jgi:intraflagellar transport protein 52